MTASPLRYAITDRFQISSEEENPPSAGLADQRQAILVRQATQLAIEGIDFLQLREKDLSAAETNALARRLLVALCGSKTKLLINARADIAIAAGAHGVHLTSSPDELTPQQVHDLYATASLPPPIVTISCHTLADVARCRLEPVTAVLFGPVFEKVTFSLSEARQARFGGTGVNLLRQACQAAAPLPVLALGGVMETTISACLDAGASGVAGIRLFQRL